MALCIMHQLALVFLGLFISGHLAAIFVGACRAAGGGVWGRMRAGWQRIARSVAMAVPLAIVMLWAASFASSAIRKPVVSEHVDVAYRLRGLLQMVPLSPFSDPLYRYCLLLLVLLPLSLVAIRAVRASRMRGPAGAAASSALGLTAVVALAVFALGPRWFLGAGYFAPRMSVLFVVCCLLALAPLTLPRPLQRAVLAAALCLMTPLAVIRYRQTSAIVNALTPIYDARSLQEGGWGAIVSGQEEDVDGLTFNPYFWAGAHYARQSKAILLNAPWIYGPLAVITPRAAHAWDGALPGTMRGILSSPGQRAAAPKLAFLCGGKWDPGRLEMATSIPLKRDLGFVRVFESEVNYCDGRPGSTTAATP